jgi:integrase
MLELSPRTQKDYFRSAHKRLIPVFGHLDPADLETSDVAQYLEGRKEKARVSANKEMACLSSAYEYGLRMGLVKSNPCRGVRRNKVRPRRRYVEDAEFLAVFNAAPEWFQDYMSGVYLMGVRPQEARDLLRTSITPKGVVFQESKTQKIRQIGWSDALQCFLTRATSRFPNSPYVFTNSKGQRLTEWAVHSMLHRIREQVGGEPFRIHDLRAKAESDHKTGLGLLALYKRRHVTSPVR